MRIGGLQKLTLIDYPGKLAATVFLSGCNFRCPFCYSSELVLPEKIKNSPEISQKELFSFLEERKEMLEGVVLCGGEPCLNKDLEGLAKKIKRMGYSLKLDTNGSDPLLLKSLIKKELIDYVAMDIKGPKEKYREIVKKNISVKKIEESVNLLIKGDVDYEFRTTVVPKFISKSDLLEMAKWISGAKKYYLQNFRPEKTLDPQLEKIKPYSDEYILDAIKVISPFFEVCELRPS